MLKGVQDKPSCLNKLTQHSGSYSNNIATYSIQAALSLCHICGDISTEPVQSTDFSDGMTNNPKGRDHD